MNNTYNVLPFYSSLDQQFNQQSYCSDDYCTWKLISPDTRLIPFQFARAAGVAFGYTVSLHDMCSGVSTDITSLIDAGDVTFVNDGEVDWFTYFGNIDLSEQLDCGIYYLEVTLEDSPPMYSEVFHVMNLSGMDFTIYRTTMSKDIPGVLRRTTDTGDLRIVNS